MEGNRVDQKFLSIRHVAKSFGSVRALRDVSLDISEGEFITFLGPSGCGKTTLLRIVAGFLSSDGGQVMLDGTTIDSLPPYRRPVGMVFQNLALFPHLTVKQNLEFGLTLQKRPAAEIRQRVTDMLKLVGMPDFHQRRIGQLSGGQRQRVALGRALVTEPKVLLLDEPLSALDLKLRRQMQVELKEIQRRTNTTFIFVTHDQEEAMALSDRIIVFNAGQIEQTGTPEEIYSQPRTKFVADFVGESNFFLGNAANGSISIPQLGIEVEALGGFRTAQGQVQLSVRPEDIAVSETKTSQQAFSGTILDREYAGSFVRLTVLTEHNQVRVRLLQPSAAATSLADGKQIWMCLDTSRAASLSSETGL